MKFVQFEPLFIRNFSTDIWPYPLHNHNHYELIYISEGSGIHLWNNQITNYSGKTLLFLSPEDLHEFDIKIKTQFHVLKFLPSVLNNGINSCTSDYWNNLLISLVRNWNSNENKKNVEIITEKIQPIFDVMILEWESNAQKVTEIHTNLLRSILLIIDKYLKNNTHSNDAYYGETLIERIQNYIHTQIKFPKKLTVKSLSNIFELSGSGLSAFFKSKMEMTLSAYITSFRIETIKNRIQNSDQSMFDIALEFGFSDASHFNKFFQKHTGMKPSLFRNSSKKRFL